MRWVLNADVTFEVDAEDEDEAREAAERFIDQATVDDITGTVASVAAFLFGPEPAKAEDEARPRP